MTTIIGVDFSGARADKNTWVARGLLDTDGSLVLESVQSIRREDLYRLLADIPVPAVAALDFPFGVPAQFAAFLSPRRQPSDMPDLWKVIDSIIADEFIRERNRFVIQHGEPKRAGDRKYHPESYSPLHAVNPNMLPMTYQGIRLLRRWHEEQLYRWWVPPLPLATAADAVVTLLELMPGALLKSWVCPTRATNAAAIPSKAELRSLTTFPANPASNYPIWKPCTRVALLTTTAWTQWLRRWERRCGRKTLTSSAILPTMNCPMHNSKDGSTSPSLPSPADAPPETKPAQLPNRLPPTASR